MKMPVLCLNFGETKRMTKQMRALSIIFLTIIQVVALPALCSVPRANYYWNKRSLIFTRPLDFSKGLNVACIQPMVSLRNINADDIGQVIPKDMSPTGDSGNVAFQILDHSLSNFFNSSAIRNSDLGRTASKVEKSMEGNVAFGSKKPNSTQHSVKFAMKAAQTKALVEYTGYTNAQVSYHVAQSKLDVEVREDVSALKTQVVYNHTDIQNAEKVDMFSLRWGW